MTRTKRRHVFVEDPDARDPLGRQWCMCSLPFDNAVHELPVRSDEEREAEMRRMGEVE